MSAPILTSGKKWYVAFTRPNGEMVASRHLKNQDFAVYLPRYLKKRRSGRRTTQIIAPLFPRYIFVGLNIELQRWRSINGTVGISHLICQGERPIPVDTRLIEAVAGQEGKDGLVRLAPARPLALGQRVRVTDGVFVEQLGLYEGLGDQNRVRILLDLLGQKVKVLIEADMVVAA